MARSDRSLPPRARIPAFPAQLAIYGRSGAAVIEGDALQTFAVEGREALSAATPNVHAWQVATGGTNAATAQTDAAASAKTEWAWGDAHRAQLLDFTRCCREGGTPLADGRAGLAAMELVHALYESARTGGEVRLPTA